MKQKLKKVMAEIFEVSIEQINESKAMDNIETWDSLKHISLMSSIMEMFEVKLESEEMIKMTSFKNIKYILSAKGIQF